MVDHYHDKLIFHNKETRPFCGVRVKEQTNENWTTSPKKFPIIFPAIQRDIKTAHDSDYYHVERFSLTFQPAGAD